MNESKWNTRRYAKGKKQVEHIKGFYKHLTVYLLVNLGLFVIKSNVMDFFAENATNDANFLEWLQWNIIATPLLWGVGLLIHGFYVFRFKSIPLKDLKLKIVKDWEEQQIKKCMDKENNRLKKRRMENLNKSKAIKAYKKVNQIKKFYWFLVSTVLVSLLFFGMAIFLSSNGAPNLDVLMMLSMPLVFGVVLLTEYTRVFDKNPFFGKKWGERKIKQFMEEEQKESEKYR